MTKPQALKETQAAKPNPAKSTSSQPQRKEDKVIDLDSDSEFTDSGAESASISTSSTTLTTPYLELGELVDSDPIVLMVKKATGDLVRVIKKITVCTSTYKRKNGKMELYRRQVESSYPEKAPEE